MSEVHRIKCGNGNCYIIENGTCGILVDTGKREFADKVTAACRQYKVKLIVLTHAHFDHAENAALISETLGIPIAMNEKDLDLIRSNKNQELYAGTFFGKIVLSVSLKDFSKRKMSEFKPDVLLNGGDSLDSYGIKNIEIIELPGHTNGSIGIIVDKKHLIVGDSLMNMFYPTVSMIFHDKNTMLESARKIGAFGAGTVYFGHGKPLTNRQWGK